MVNPWSLPILLAILAVAVLVAILERRPRPK
jgi:hypothetical protein